jgi:hypothetical protein
MRLASVIVVVLGACGGGASQQAAASEAPLEAKGSLARFERVLRQGGALYVLESGCASWSVTPPGLWVPTGSILAPEIDDDGFSKELEYVFEGDRLVFTRSVRRVMPEGERGIIGKGIYCGSFEPVPRAIGEVAVEAGGLWYLDVEACHVALRRQPDAILARRKCGGGGGG